MMTERAGGEYVVCCMQVFYIFMHTLFLDLASHGSSTLTAGSGLIAAIADDRIVASESLDHRVDDAELVPAVESILKKAGWSYSDLTQIACVIGPGGFTSLRVAVALANTLSSQLKIPACGLHLSDVYAARSSAPALWLHSTKKTELFVRVAHEEPRCINLDELKVIIKKGMTWMGELIPEHQKIIDVVGALQASLRSLEEVLPGFLSAQKYEKRILQPWYGRGW